MFIYRYYDVLKVRVIDFICNLYWLTSVIVSKVRFLVVRFLPRIPVSFDLI